MGGVVMKVNILMTGSAGNCLLATYSDGRQVIFDFGTGAWKKCIEANLDYHKIDNVLVTHQHLDHCGDYHRIRTLDFPMRCKVKEFEVLHNCPNKGFIVLNEATKEGFVYATDYHTLPQDSLDLIKKHIAFKEWKWFVMMELSYVRWIYEKLDPLQMIGLNNHCSYERFCHYADELFAVNDAINILTVHASARQGEFELGSNKTGDVCPPDYIRDNLYKKYGSKELSVRFGYAQGMCGNYNFIERK